MEQQSTTRSFAILSIAGIAAKLISLLYIPILSRIIHSDGMASYYKIYDVFVFIYAVTNVGMQTAISKYVAELSAVGNYKDSVRTFKISRTILFVLGSICTLVLLVFSKQIAIMTNNNGIEYGLMCIAPAIVTTAILSTYRAYFQGRSQMKPVAIASVLEQFANVVISLIFASILIKYGSALGSAGGTIGTSIGALLAVIYLVYVYNVFKPEKEAKIKQSEDVKRIKTKKIVKTLLKYGIPITLTAGLQNFGNILDMSTVNSRLLVAGFTKVEADGMYSLLGQWRTLINIPMIFITSLCVALLPILSRARVLKDRMELKKNMNFAFRVTYVLAIPCTIGLTVLAREIYMCMFGEDVGAPMMFLGSITIILMSIVFVQNIILQSLNEFYFVVYTLVFGLVIKLIANYILIANKSINIYGAIIGFIAYFGSVMIINNYKVKRITKYKIDHLAILYKPLVASVAMGSVILGIKLIVNMLINTASLPILILLIYTGILVAVGSLVYGALLIKLRAIKAEDIKALSPRLYNKLPNKIKVYL